MAAISAISRNARADICFPTPFAVPGLSGAPLWEGAGVLRGELNEPRWAAAPLTGFASDPTGGVGQYRMLVDPAYSELSVSFQAPTDLGSASAADMIYFGFTTDGLGGYAAKGVAILMNGLGTSDPVDVATAQQFNYDVAATPQWSNAPFAPTWLKQAAAWRNHPSGAAWGINFKVNLQAAGLSAANPFKIQLALHRQDELDTSKNADVSTPDPGLQVLKAGTLFINDPTHWAPALGINAGCASGIALSGNQIGTRNTASGSPAPTTIDTTDGVVNHFYITPTVPGNIALSGNLFQASFHLANWGAVAAPDAVWSVLPNGTAIVNGASPAPNDSTIEFACPPNTATTTCGIPTPAEKNQSVYVELQAVPGQPIPFTTAAAYVNMEFKCLGCPATGGTGGSGTGGGDMGGAGMNSGGMNSGGTNSGGTSSGGTSGATNGGSAPNAGAGGVFENAAGVGGAETGGAASDAGGALSGGATAAGGQAVGNAGASPAGSASGGSARASASPDKSGCSCTVSGSPSERGCGALAFLALSVTAARRRRSAALRAPQKKRNT